MRLPVALFLLIAGFSLGISLVTLAAGGPPAVVVLEWALAILCAVLSERARGGD
jgi:hypothetical protein